MDWHGSFAISAAGMQVEQTRFNIAALNLANANAVMKQDGSGFRPLTAVTGTGQYNTSFSSYLTSEQIIASQLPRVQAIVEQNAAPHRVYDPGNPEADDKGFVQMPGVNSTSEMLNIMTALRAYEGNVVAMNAAKSMALKALDIGSGA